MDSLTIRIIRHAEKVEEAWPGPGLNARGNGGQTIVAGTGGWPLSKSSSSYHLL